MKKFLYKAVAFSGPSNSGKTTLIEKLVKKLILKYKILVIKHDPKDKAQFDTEGKDSYKFFQTGADTVVLSPTRTTYFSHQKREVEDIIKMFDFDYLFVEGLKEIDLPRVSIFRGKISDEYIPYSNAIAIDESIKIKSDLKVDVLNLNNIDEIFNWIEKNAKVVK